MKDNRFVREVFQRQMRWLWRNQPAKFREFQAMLEAETGRSSLGEQQPDMFSLEYWRELGTTALDTYINYELAKEQQEFEREIASNNFQKEIATAQQEAALAEQAARTEQALQEAAQAREELRTLREKQSQAFGRLTTGGLAVGGLLLALVLFSAARG